MTTPARDWKFDKFDVVVHNRNKHLKLYISARTYDIDEYLFLYLTYSEAGADWFLADVLEENYEKEWLCG